MVLILIYLLCFLDIFNLGLLLPIVSIHITSLGGTRFTIGLLASVHALLQLLSGPLIGSWSDAKGRKILLIQSLFLSLLSNLLLTITSSLPIYIVSRIIFGLSCQVQPLLKALVADNVPRNEQNSVFGKLGSIVGLCFIAGPLLGGFVNSLEHGFFYVALILSASSLISIGVAYFLPNVKLDRKEKTEKTLTQELAGAFTNLKKVNWNTFWDVFLFKFLVESSFSAFFTSFGILMTAVFGASQQQMAYVISFFSATSIFANLSIGRIKKLWYGSDAKGLARNYHGFVGLSFVFVVMYAFPTFWTYVLLLVPMALSKTVLDTTWTEMLVSRTTATDKGTIMGSFESVLQMAGLATPLITGYVGDSWGYSAALAVNIIPVVAGCVVANYCFTRDVKVQAKKE